MQTRIPATRLFNWCSLAFSVLCAGLITSCSTDGVKQAPPLEAPEAFSRSGTGTVPDRWWTAFEDSDLNGLVDQALRSNFSLKTAWQRLKEAQAVVQRESAPLFPLLEGAAEWQRTSVNSDDEKGFQFGLAAEYEVDLWGRIQAGVDAESFRAQATRADYRAAAVSLSAEVVLTWFQIAEAHRQLSLVKAQIETNGKVLHLIENRFGAGQVRRVDLLRQKQLVESTREELIAAQSRKQVLEHRMAVLLGRSPSHQFTADTPELPEPPPLPQTGLPAELVRRRPDLQSAFHYLRAADRDLAAAISNRYPRVALSASISTTSRGTYRLFEDWASSLLGSITEPLFDAGERAAEMDRTEAVKKQRLYEYAQAVLTAFREVEDALISEQKQTERVKSLTEQLSLAEKALTQLRIEYFNGVRDYIDVLAALSDQQRLSREVIAARRLRLEYRIALYRALAGGFTTERETET